MGEGERGEGGREGGRERERERERESREKPAFLSITQEVDNVYVHLCRQYMQGFL